MFSYFLGDAGLFCCCIQQYWSSSGFMIRAFGVVFAGPEAFSCSLLEYETHGRYWPFYYCLTA